jgi:hypothetical protein
MQRRKFNREFTPAEPRTDAICDNRLGRPQRGRKFLTMKNSARGAGRDFSLQNNLECPAENGAGVGTAKGLAIS